jgi:DNA-binding transcriptional ArsR family regulator
MAYENALAALADPTRRAVFERLRHGPACVREIADHLPVSRPAVSQHLKALKDAGLVRDEPRGTARIYSIHTPGLRALRDWVEGFWDDALESFKTYAEKE